MPPQALEPPLKLHGVGSACGRGDSVPCSEIWREEEGAPVFGQKRRNLNQPGPAPRTHLPRWPAEEPTLNLGRKGFTQRAVLFLVWWKGDHPDKALGSVESRRQAGSRGLQVRAHSDGGWGGWLEAVLLSELRAGDGGPDCHSCRVCGSGSMAVRAPGPLSACPGPHFSGTFKKHFIILNTCLTNNEHMCEKEAEVLRALNNSV